MPRILHTADWQLGLKLRRLTGDHGAVARNARFDTVAAIAEVARARQVDLVVVAGDVFDDNQVDGWTVQRAVEALDAFAPTPVALTAGNHDAAEPGAVLAQVAERAGAHVHVLLDPAPVELGGVQLHPCSLTQRRTLSDPTAHLPARAPDDAAVRVAVAHGGAHGFSNDDDGVGNLIDVEGILAKGFDYVALGDWHAPKQLAPRAWYAGTPEPTRFKDAPGRHVLIVDLPAAGEEPTVEQVEVAQLDWYERRDLVLHTGDDVDALDAWLAGLPRRSRSLVRLHLSGALPLDARQRLDAILDAHGEALMSLQIRSDAIVTRLDPDALHAPGFLDPALRALLDRGDAVGAEAARLLAGFLARAETR